MASMRNLHIMLFIGAVCVVQTMAQVCPYRDPACTCSTDTLVCQDLQQIPTVNTGVNVSHVTHLFLNGGNITSFSKNSLPSGLQSIRFIDIPLANMSEDAFEGSAGTLQDVSFKSVHLTVLPAALRNFTSLNILLVVETPLLVWDNATVTHLGATLRQIDIYEIGLSAWPSWISSFHLLQELELSWNAIRHIPDNAFNSFKESLRELYLENIGLTYIPQALSTLTGLANLFLSYNDFSNVTEFKQITESPVAQTLSVLNLASTGLTRMPNFSNLTNLTVLDASNNRISDVPAGSLPLSLTQLYLSGNKLSFVPTYVARMTNLSYLELTRNHITSVEPSTFPPSLTELYLSYNDMTIITNSTFRNLNLMQSLSLAQNPISTILPAAFSDLVALKNFNIRNSRLTKIPVAFAKLSPQIRLFFSTHKSLDCPCPAPYELAQWFRSLEYPFQTNCSNGQPIRSYLSDPCGQPTVPP